MDPSAAEPGLKTSAAAFVPSSQPPGGSRGGDNSLDNHAPEWGSASVGGPGDLSSLSQQTSQFLGQRQQQQQHQHQQQQRQQQQQQHQQQQQQRQQQQQQSQQQSPFGGGLGMGAGGLGEANALAASLNATLSASIELNAFFSSFMIGFLRLNSAMSMVL